MFVDLRLIISAQVIYCCMVNHPEMEFLKMHVSVGRVGISHLGPAIQLW